MPTFRSIFAVLGLLFVGGLGRALAQAPSSCDLPKVLVVMDKSSSMNGLLQEQAGLQPKWQIARDALGRLVGSFGTSLNFGLVTFPSMPSPTVGGECRPGNTQLAPAQGSSQRVVGAYGDPPPSQGNWTPLAQTLDGVYSSLCDTAQQAPRDTRYVVVVTDGYQWCYDQAFDARDGVINGQSDACTADRYWPVDAVARLKRCGITTYVVGFGTVGAYNDGVDAHALAAMAISAGTSLCGTPSLAAIPARASCLKAGTTCGTDTRAACGSNTALADPTRCYYQANDGRALNDALSKIGRTVTTEQCDGLDNNCDGRIDEGFDKDSDGYTVCGTQRQLNPDGSQARDRDGRPAFVSGPTRRELIDCDDTNPRKYPGGPIPCEGAPKCDPSDPRSCPDGQICDPDTLSCVANGQRGVSPELDGGQCLCRVAPGLSRGRPVDAFPAVLAAVSLALSVGFRMRRRELSRRR